MRLRMLLVAIMLGFGLGGQAISDAQESDHDVPMFRGDAARTGVMPGPGPDPSSGIAERWRFSTDGGIQSSPAVVDGVVYVGSGDGTLYALDAASGDERWHFATGERIFSSPSVVDGVFYVGSDDANLYAVDATSGDERWRFTAGDSIQSSPSVVDGVVYIGSNDDNLYAVDAASGEERWHFDVGDNIYSSPAVVDGVVYMGSDDGNLYALAARPLVLEAGGQAVVREETVLRGAPALSGVERATLAPGTALAIVGEPETTTDEVWWPVQVEETSEQGWVRAAELEPTSTAPQVSATPGP